MVLPHGNAAGGVTEKRIRPVRWVRFERPGFDQEGHLALRRLDTALAADTMLERDDAAS